MSLERPTGAFDGISLSRAKRAALRISNRLSIYRSSRDVPLLAWADVTDDYRRAFIASMHSWAFGFAWHSQLLPKSRSSSRLSSFDSEHPEIFMRLSIGVS